MILSAFLSRLAGATIVVALAGAAPPAAAVRVFLDADVDGDPTTLRNEVDGPLETAVDIVVALDEGDAGLSHLSFVLEWDCTEAGGGCFLAMPHGDVAWTTLPDSYPFSDIGMITCTGLDCDCVAARYMDAMVDALPVGSFVLGTLPFTRLGAGANCEDLVYPDVEFRVHCDPCDYAPGDDAFTVMRLLGSSPATDASEGVTSSTWGESKAAYR
jgi:hypothetical protein